jgi:hypothetical protein
MEKEMTIIVTYRGHSLTFPVPVFIFTLPSKTSNCSQLWGGGGGRFPARKKIPSSSPLADGANNDDKRALKRINKSKNGKSRALGDWSSLVW